MLDVDRGGALSLDEVMTKSCTRSRDEPCITRLEGFVAMANIGCIKILFLKSYVIMQTVRVLHAVCKEQDEGASRNSMAKDPSV